MGKIQIANAPCSWGALEFELEGKALGYEQVLDEMHETGYAGTELGDWGFMPTDPAELHTVIKARLLQLLGAFVPVALANENAHQDGLEKALKVAKLMKLAGYPNAFIVLADENGTVPQRTQNAGRITPEMGLTEDQWKIFAQGADFIAAGIKEKLGMRTVFHHHCAGYVETPEEIDTLLSLTQPGLLGLCLDMGHYAFGGGDPLMALKKYYDRIWHVHFKDYDPAIGAESRKHGYDYFQSVSKGVFCELGKGSVDFKSIAEELKIRGYDGWIVVEQDVLPGMGNPKECAQANRDYIKSLGF
ncbi:MAG: TIM barrel protein [Cyclobacteriaceae bacterium]|nr:TIM barrel protein [Cyclobacteriaceae bacterium]